MLVEEFQFFGCSSFLMLGVTLDVRRISRWNSTATSFSFFFRRIPHSRNQITPHRDAYLSLVAVVVCLTCLFFVDAKAHKC